MIYVYFINKYNSIVSVTYRREKHGGSRFFGVKLVLAYTRDAVTVLFRLKFHRVLRFYVCKSTVTKLEVRDDNNMIYPGRYTYDNFERLYMREQRRKWKTIFVKQSYRNREITSIEIASQEVF